DFREQVAFPPEKVVDAIGRARALDGVEELVIVSTCNRTELYVEVDLPDEDRTGEPEQQLLEWLSTYHGLNAEELRRCSYFHWQEDVVRHLMRVACGVDSMVLGEPRILGQIKSAFAVAKEEGAIRTQLVRAFQAAVS